MVRSVTRHIYTETSLLSEIYIKKTEGTKVTYAFFEQISHPSALSDGMRLPPAVTVEAYPVCVNLLHQKY